MIDVAGTLRQFYSHEVEREVASLGPIHYSQAVQWREVRCGVEGPTVRNSDYNPRFDSVTWGGAQPRLAGFPPTHPAWN